jgi:hypothetical protein
MINFVITSVFLSAEAFVAAEAVPSLSATRS